MAPIYTNFEGGARAKKTQLGQIFPQSAKNACFGLLFQNFACGAETLPKTGTKLCVGRAQFSRPKKKGRQNFEQILKIRPPPRENP